MRARRNTISPILALGALAAYAAPAPPPIPAPPPPADVLIVPLHAHVLSAPDRPDIDCKLTDDDLARILGKVNRVWRQAGVQFVVTVHREAAADLEAFDRRHAASPGELGVYRVLAPAATRELPGLHVYYVHELPPNGVYLGDRVCFVKETAALREVVPELDAPKAGEAARAIVIAVGAYWTHAHPPANLRQVYDADPALVFLPEQFRAALERVIAVTILGLLAA